MNPSNNREQSPVNAQQAADRTIHAMENPNLNPDQLTSSEKEAHILGELLRGIAKHDLPDANPELRELLSEKIDNGNPQVAPQKPIKPAKPTSSRWLIGLTSAAALLVIGAIGFQSFYLGEQAPVAVNFEPSSSGPHVSDDSPKILPGTKAMKPNFEPTAELDLDFHQNSFGSGIPKDSTIDGKKSDETKKTKTGKVEAEPAGAADKNYSLSGGGMHLGKVEELHRLDGQTRPVPANQFGQSTESRSWHVQGQGGGGFAGGGFSTGSRGFGEGFEEESYPARRPRFQPADISNEQYEANYENAFKPTQGQSALSTFSIDVDTASYANMRRFINRGQRVPANSVRIEEFVNYFQYDYPQPENDQPFSVNMELATCPWNEQNKLLRVGLKGKEVHRDERPAANIVFLIDVSGSMRSADKLPLLKSGFQMMVNSLNENDMVSIVTYAGNSSVVLQPTSGDQKQKINAAIDALSSGGSTNGSAGIETAYRLAQENLIKDGTNKVILATDGDLNVGVTSDTDLVSLISNKASEGVFLTVLGFGTGNLKDAKMEKIADNGNGVYAYIDGIREAHKVLIEGMSGSLVTIAKDVKVQIEFNPGEVKAYRLIGYENRVLAAKDFDDDTKDAGEIGAGHTVTALYELVTNDAPSVDEVDVQGLKYQKTKPSPKAEIDSDDDENAGELLTLALRYKKPDEDISKRIEYTLANEDNRFSTASGDFKFASSVAAFAMILRGSEHRGNATPQWVKQIATEAMGDDLSGYRAEFIDLVRRFQSVR